MKGKAYVVPTLVVVLGPQVTSIIKWHSRKPNHTRQSEWVSVRESWFSSETHTLARPLPYSQFSLLQKSHTISFYYLPLVAAFAYKHLRSLSLSLSLFRFVMFTFHWLIHSSLHSTHTLPFSLFLILWIRFRNIIIFNFPCLQKIKNCLRRQIWKCFNWNLFSFLF